MERVFGGGLPINAAVLLQALFDGVGVLGWHNLRAPSHTRITLHSSAWQDARAITSATIHKQRSDAFVWFFSIAYSIRSG